MEKFKFLIFVFISVLLLLSLISCSNEELKKVRAMKINHINTSDLNDGKYKGDFTYGRSTYIVEVSIKDHKIDDIIILLNRKTKYAKKAEEVVERVLEQQKNDVDAITGATTTSKALLKAIENALMLGKK